MELYWKDFDSFGEIFDRYVPSRGQGETKASQLATSVVKLIYKWFNDGDVFDSSYYLGGWANNLSSYANWIYEYCPQFCDVLDDIAECRNGGDYTRLLYSLCEMCDAEDLENMNKEPMMGDIYKCDGKFKFRG